MTYATGTVTDANPGPALYAALEPTLFTAGFTLEDTVVIGSRTHKVLKSDATDNDQGLTWFLDISFPTTGTSGGMLMTPFEDFDAGTDTAYRGPYSSGNGTIDATTYSRYGATGYGLETSWANTASFTALDTPLSISSMGWFLSATTDRVIFTTTADGAQLHYVGFFEPTPDHAAHAAEALFPLIVAHFGAANSIPVSASAANSNAAALTRSPKVSAINWAAHVILDIPFALLSGSVGGGASAQTGKTTMARRPVIAGNSTLTSSSVPAESFGLVGYLLDVVSTWTDGTITRGDTITDDNADTWVAVDDASRLGLWFKAV